MAAVGLMRRIGARSVRWADAAVLRRLLHVCLHAGVTSTNARLSASSWCLISQLTQRLGYIGHGFQSVLLLGSVSYL